MRCAIEKDMYRLGLQYEMKKPLIPPSSQFPAVAAVPTTIPGYARSDQWRFVENPYQLLRPHLILHFLVDFDGIVQIGQTIFAGLDQVIAMHR